MRRWFVRHSTISFGKRIDLPNDPTITVFADSEDRALDLARALGFATIYGYKFEGVAAA